MRELRRVFPSLIVVAFVSTLSTAAFAHRVGLSRGEYVVSSNAAQSRLFFAHDEMRDSIPGVDANGDGHIDAGELGRAGALLRSSIVDGIRLTIGGLACSSTFERATAAEQDGIEIDIRHDCRGFDGSVGLDLGFVKALPHGHRHMAEIRAGEDEQRIVAYADSTQFRFDRNASARPGAAGMPALQYFRLGIEHILFGFDHLLFVLAMATIRTSARALLAAVTAFTAAHSVTLCLSALGAVTVSPSWVEPLIALSVAYVGLENLFHKDLSKRWRVTFLFGLVHGFGFAGALKEIGLPQDGVPLALALFNGGVEVGQFMALAAMIPILRWVHTRTHHGAQVSRILSLSVTAAGLFWCVVRIVPVSSARPASSAQLAPLAASPATAVPSSERVTARDDRQSGADHSTYPRSLGAVPERVEELCRALHELPQSRRAQCKGTKPSVGVIGECRRILGAAVESGAVRIDEDGLHRCLDDRRRTYEGCGWVDEPSLPPIATCTNVLHGTLAMGRTCRSSVECQPGLFCRGVGPMDTGTCAASLSAGASCGYATDPLLTYVHAVTAPTDECDGVCAGYRCRNST